MPRPLGLPPNQRPNWERLNEGQRRYAYEQYNLARVRRGLDIDHPIPVLEPEIPAPEIEPENSNTEEQEEDRGSALHTPPPLQAETPRPDSPDFYGQQIPTPNYGSENYFEDQDEFAEDVNRHNENNISPNLSLDNLSLDPIETPRDNYTITERLDEIDQTLIWILDQVRIIRRLTHQ